MSNNSLQDNNVSTKNETSEENNSPGFFSSVFGNYKTYESKNNEENNKENNEGNNEEYEDEISTDEDYESDENEDEDENKEKNNITLEKNSEIYIVCEDETPLFYSDNIEKARNKMWDIARTFVWENYGNYNCYICEPVNTKNELKIIGFNNGYIIHYDRDLRNFKIRTVSKVK